ncbi:phage tail terminator family protein [Lysinibacillus sp. JNUCC 51]|uniref:phage tail terminator family protein n=1 Tax=Lysinibacillus sp. JNUCC-51 TaxID=2792479 RepID=UPI0019366D80|nr:hypothetical protein JNUCC51_00380 [Lysinibacillus sp. JNUCC-51]
MITYKDIKNAINHKLDVFDVEINSRDVSEGFERPSFFVRLENSKRSGDGSQVHKTMNVQIYYFPSDRYEYSIEVLEIQERLEELFDLKLPVRDRLLNIDELNTDLIDGVLNCSFDLEFYDGRKSDTIIDDLNCGEDFREKYPIELIKELDFEKVEE